MGKHLTTPRKLTRDPWILAVIIAELVAVCFLLVAIPSLHNDAENLGKLLAFLLELLKQAGMDMAR